MNFSVVAILAVRCGAIATRWLLLLFMSFAIAQEPTREVSSPEEAIRLAETFIVEQGYTDAPGNPDAFQPEQFRSNDPRSRSEILSERAGTTSPTAYAYLKDDFTGTYQWWVYFRYDAHGAYQCSEWFRVVNVVSHEQPYGRGLLVINDLIRSLDPDAKVVEERSPDDCGSEEANGAA